MGIGSIGVTGFLLILLVGLLLFGPSKLPELGRAFGKTLREFKNGAREMMSEEEEAETRRKEVGSSSSNRTTLEHERADERSEQDSRRLPD